MLLQNVFKSTNVIKRKKDNIDMINIGVIIFDQRFKKYKNSNINLLKKKNIQIGKNKNISDFINKINRVVDYEIFKINNRVKDNNIQNFKDYIWKKNNNKILFYKVKKNNKDIIIEMLICFINNILIYESVFIQELNFSENQKISEMFKTFNPKTELLIIEILDNNSNTKFINQIKPMLDTQQYICSICNKVITNVDEAIRACDICNMYLFCSKECCRNKTNEKSNNHYLLLKFLSELKWKEFNLNDFLNKKFYSEIYTKENNRKNKGIVGLFNLGNTCYINCSLQCLSNTKDLTKYFINNYYQNEINLSNISGTNGCLLKAYSDLIFKMWLTEDLQQFYPYFFRISFCLSTNKFLNNNQQDAMEFLSILLNNLHEDLKRVKYKPQQKNGQESSIIYDLFHGQYKNVIKCENCFKERITFETFINITLPIPEKHNFYIIKFFTNSKCKYITINIDSNTTFGQLVEKSTKYLNPKILDAWKMCEKIKNQNSYSNEFSLNDCIEIVQLGNDKLINKIYSEFNNQKEYLQNYYNKLIDYVKGGDEIVLFEREIIPNYLLNIYVYPIIEDAQSGKMKILSYPVVFSVRHDLKLGELEKLIFDKFKNILNNDTLKALNNNNKNINHIIDINIMHSSKDINTSFFKFSKEYKKCPFCQCSFDEYQFCSLYITFSKTNTVQELINNFSRRTNYSEPLVLLARSKYFDINKKVYNDFNFEENNLINKNRNIYDSFNIFGKSESLGEDNLWNCPNCHQRSTVNKSIRIYQPPNYLIIQLKRFKQKSEGFFSFLESDKNETFVSFPTNNLDLTNYIEGPDKFNSIYNLYAVINHKSNFGCNHFTAYCKNNNNWIEYDDHKVSRINDPISREAYILFYIKKEIDK